MAKYTEEGEVYDEINVVPMLDLAYVLIVIFILLATAAVSGIEVNLPKAANTVPLDQPETQAITVSSDGQMFLNGYPVSPDELRTQLTTVMASDPETPVIIRGDTATAYGRVIEVLDIVKGAGVTKIGLPSEQITTG